MGLDCEFVVAAAQIPHEGVAGVVTVIDRLAWDYDDSDLVRARGYAFGDPERLVRPTVE